MFSNNRLIFGKVYAEGLIVGDIALDPLDVGTELVQHLIRLGGGAA